MNKKVLKILRDQEKTPSRHRARDREALLADNHPGHDQHQAVTGGEEAGCAE